MSTTKIKIDADLSDVKQEMSAFRQELSSLKQDLNSATGKNRLENEFQAAGNALDKLVKRYDVLQRKLDSMNKSSRQYRDLVKELGSLTSEAAKVSLRVENTGSLKSSARSGYFAEESNAYRAERQSLIDQARRDADAGRADARESASSGRWFSHAASAAGIVGGAALGGGGALSIVGSTLGGALRFIPGAGPILGAFGSAVGGKIGGMADASYNPAKDEAIQYSELRRAIGSTRVDFDELRGSVRTAADGLGVAYTEASKLADTFTRVSNASDAGDIGKSVNTAVGFSRAYGISAAASTSFFAGLRSAGVTRDDNGNQRLANMIGQAVARGGISLKMEEVLGVVSNFVQTSMQNLTTGGVPAYLSALSSMVSSSSPGLSGNPQNAASILGQADAAYRAGGAMGEASKTFMLQAFTEKGFGMTPTDVKAMQEAGMFTPMSSVFGKHTELYKAADPALRRHYDALAKHNLVGLDPIYEKLNRMHGGDMNAMLSSYQGMFGGTLQQNASLFNMVRGRKGISGSSKEFSELLKQYEGNKDLGTDYQRQTAEASNHLQNKMDSLVTIETSSKDLLAGILRHFDPTSSALKKYDADNAPNATEGGSAVERMVNWKETNARYQKWRHKDLGNLTGGQRDIAQQIIEESLRQNVDPKVALGIAMKESSLGANLEGKVMQSGMHKGDRARGVFHYMAKSSRGWDRNNIDENIRRGVSDLKRNYERFGRYDLAAAAHLTGAERPEYERGEFPAASDGMSSAREYARDVMAYADEFDKKLPEGAKATSTKPLQAQVNGTFVLQDSRGRQVADPVNISTSFGSPVPAGL
jgi:hypothetical protein